MLECAGMDAHIQAALKQHGVTQDQLVAFLHAREIRKTRSVGFVITAALTLGLFFLGWSSANEYPWALGVGAGALGLVIGILAIRHSEGRRSRWIDYPDDTAPGFTLLGVLHALSPEQLAKISEEDWERMRSLPKHTAPKTDRETSLKTLMNMTPKKERLARNLHRWQKWACWMILPGLLVLVTPGMFFLWWAWTFAGLWLGLEAVLGIVERKIGFFSETQNIDIYGRPAQIISWFVLLVWFLVFFVPGVLGMASELGFDLLALL